MKFVWVFLIIIIISNMDNIYSKTNYNISKSGIKVYKNYKDNIIIGKNVSQFYKMRESKLKALCSENSEDAMTWNIFMTLKKYNNDNSLKILCQEIKLKLNSYSNSNIRCWEEHGIDKEHLKVKEGLSEIDVIIETDKDIIFIEAKYKSPLSYNTKYSKGRDQIIRNIDVGSLYAHKKNKDFHFILLLFNSSVNQDAIKLLNNYQNIEDVKYKLFNPYYKKIKSINYMTGHNIKNIINNLKVKVDNDSYINKLSQWLNKKVLD